MDEIARLDILCRSWGWRLEEVTSKEFRTRNYKMVPSWHEAPFCNGIAIDTTNRCFVYSQERSDKELWCDLIHEMAHVFACPKKDFLNNDELKMLGWEVAMVFQIDGDLDVWAKNNSNYGLDVGKTMGDLSFVELAETLLDRLSAAKSAKLLNKDYTCRSVRKFNALI